MEGVVIVNGQMGGKPWGFDVKHNGALVGHRGSHSDAVSFACGFSAGIFAETGVLVSVEDHSTCEEEAA